MIFGHKLKDDGKQRQRKGYDAVKKLKDLQQGVFTYALLEGLGSKGKKATVERLNEHLKYRVKELAKSQGKQTPSIMVTRLRSLI